MQTQTVWFEQNIWFLEEPLSLGALLSQLSLPQAIATHFLQTSVRDKHLFIFSLLVSGNHLTFISFGLIWHEVGGSYFPSHYILHSQCSLSAGYYSCPYTMQRWLKTRWSLINPWAQNTSQLLFPDVNIISQPVSFLVYLQPPSAGNNPEEIRLC